MRTILITLLLCAIPITAKAWIIQPNPSGTPSPIPSPVALQKAGSIVRSTATRFANNAIGTGNRIYTQIWANPNGLTAQQVFNQLDSSGTQGDSCKALQLLNNITTLVNASLPGSIPVNPNPPTTSGTGTSCSVNTGGF